MSHDPHEKVQFVGQNPRKNDITLAHETPIVYNTGALKNDEKGHKMRIENGILVLEQAECWSCDGSGEQDERVRVSCPKCGGNGRGVRGGWQGCKNCHGVGYEWATTGQQEPCYQCDGHGMKDETIFDRVSDAMWASMNFEVRGSNRNQSWQEQYIGLGCWSVTDYGRHQGMTDEELIAKVRDDRGSSLPQVCKLIVSKEDLRIAESVAIVTARSGYSVIGVSPE